MAKTQIRGSGRLGISESRKRKRKRFTAEGTAIADETERRISSLSESTLTLAAFRRNRLNPPTLSAESAEVRLQENVGGAAPQAFRKPADRRCLAENAFAFPRAG
jgi:hypothetical protein